jgi:hypothetical protein
MIRDLAKVWEAYDGKVKVWMLPYKRMGFNKAFDDLMGGDYNNTDKQFFAVLDWCLIDAEIDKGAPSVWRALAVYLKHRKPHDLKHNWEVFQTVGSATLIEELNITYEETRETLLSDTYYDAKGDDPKA